MLQILLLYAYVASIYNQDHEQLSLCLVVNFTGHTKIKEINTILETVPVWPAVRYISDTGQYRCTISDLPLFFTILYKVIFLITQYITLAPFYMYIYIYIFFFMELLTFTTTPYMISCEGWKKLWVYVGSHFHHSQLFTRQIMTKIV